MTTKPDWLDVRRQPFLYVAFVAALAAIAGAFWWEHEYEESTPAAVVAAGAWGLAGIFAFVSGYRLERPEWKIPRLLHGVFTALIVLFVTLVTMVMSLYMAASGQIDESVAVRL